MTITIYGTDEKSYTLSLPVSSNNKILVCKEDGEGGEFSADALSDVVFSAIDKFYKDNL